MNSLYIYRVCSVIATRLLWEQESPCKSDIFDQYPVVGIHTHSPKSLADREEEFLCTRVRIG